MLALLTACGATLKKQLAVLQLHFWRGALLDHLEQIALAPDIMAFSVQILAGRLAFLFLKLSLLLLDPTQLRDCEDTDGVEAHAGWCGNGRAARWWMYAEM